MTILYGVGITSSKKDFRELMLRKNFDPESIKIFMANFIKIYSFLKGSKMELRYFYKKSMVECVNALRGMESIKVFDMVLPLFYFKVKNKKFNVIHKGKRRTLNYAFVTGEFDESKTLIAMKANIVHCYDARFMRLVGFNTYSMGSEIASIHDGFAVPFYFLPHLILNAMESFKLNLDSVVFPGINDDIELLESYTIVL